MLELKHVGFSVRNDDGSELQILRDVTLRIPKGKFVVITGPNGSGKSTLAKVIMGIEQQTAGQIIWEGEDISALNVTERAKRGISYGFQQPPRFKGMRVWDLLSCAAGRELSFADGCQLLTKVGLCSRDYIERDVDSSLSGGELKRIEIATILAKQGGLLIFDEPEAGIDLWSFHQLIATFRQLHRADGPALVIISHQERILQQADEIILLVNGELTDRGPVDRIFPKILADTTGTCRYMEGSDHAD